MIALLNNICGSLFIRVAVCVYSVDLRLMLTPDTEILLINAMLSHLVIKTVQPYILMYGLLYFNNKIHEK